MSEHSDDGFDRWLREEELAALLRDACPRDCKGCRWSREHNEDGMLECSTCGEVVDE